jgi:hypothetical protein
LQSALIQQTPRQTVQEQSVWSALQPTSILLSFAIGRLSIGINNRKTFIATQLKGALVFSTISMKPLSPAT